MSANSGKSRAVLGARVYGETVLLCAGAKAKAVLFPEWKVVLFSASRESNVYGVFGQYGGRP